MASSCKGAGTKRYVTSIERQEPGLGSSGLCVGDSVALSLQDHSPATDDDPQKRGAEGRDRHVGQQSGNRPLHLRSLLFAVLTYPVRHPGSLLSGDVLEEHSHATGDVSDESDAEDGNRCACPDFPDDPFHLRVLLFL